MLEFIFGPKNPTLAWQRLAGLALTFDLSKPALNGVELGRAAENLSWLGRDEDRTAFRAGELCYYSLGLCVECYEDVYTVTGFEIVFRDPEEQKYQSFAGTVLFHGRPVNLSALTEDKFVALFGQYFWRDVDEQESILFFEFADVEWQVEFDRASVLKRVTVTSLPLMADPEQRNAYGVTSAWPPDLRSG